MNGCLLPKPSEPLASDCCGNGCTPCVFDIYEKEVEIWKKECQEIEAGKTRNNENQVKEVISKDLYREYSIINIEKETYDTFKFRFSLKQHQKLELQVGQHLVMRWKCPGKSSINRQYTPVNNCNDVGYFDVIIKIYKYGKMSEYVRQWKVGSQVEWRGPFGKLNYKPNLFSNIVLLAAGTGIAPMTQIIHSILDNEDDETVIYLLYSIKQYEDVLCKYWLDKWKDYWNFKPVFFVTRDSKASEKVKFGEKVINDRITKAYLESVVKDDISESHFYICGTKSFDKDMINMMNALNVPDSRYNKF